MCFICIRGNTMCISVYAEWRGLASREDVHSLTQNIRRMSATIKVSSMECCINSFIKIWHLSIRPSIKQSKQPADIALLTLKGIQAGPIYFPASESSIPPAGPLTQEKWRCILDVWNLCNYVFYLIPFWFHPKTIIKHDM